MLSEFFSSVFRFRKTTVSLLCVLTYSLIGVLYVYDRVRYKYTLAASDDFSRAPQLLENAWLDLQNITETFHPFTSRANVKVHDYLLGRVLKMTQDVEYAAVSDDMESGRVHLSKGLRPVGGSGEIGYVTYFESANILVKIEGKDSKLPALLLSAHYDSVPTAHGATDDGKGVVSLLGILDYYCREQPQRTLIFNLNDNEEFGLLGAEAFFSHPWSKRAHYVINLEGTGTGGKSVLFRTSDVSTAKIYQKAVAKAPFGNSIYQQGFNDGLVKSETDFLVYSRNNLRGFDIAFYKPRDLYHTMKDSVQYTSREALWHMFHTAWQLTSYMAENADIDDMDQTSAVYFDILGTYFVVMSAKTLFWWGCALLITLPIVTVLFDIMGRRKDRETKKPWIVWLRFPISLAFSMAMVTAVRYLLELNNPLVPSRDYLSSLFTLSSCFVLVNYLILASWEHFSPTQDLKTIIFRQLAIISWVVLLLQTSRLYRSGYKETGAYPFTVLYISLSLGCIIGYLCRALRRVDAYEEPSKVISYGSGVQDEEVSSHNNPLDANEQTSDIVDVDVIRSENGESAPEDERAPLLHESTSTSSKKIKRTNSNTVTKTLNYDWCLQFLVAAPVLTYLLFNSVDLILSALNQTIQESEKATVILWNIILLGGVLIVVPLLPFVYKLNYFVVLSFCVTFIISLGLATLRTPFSEQYPLKVRFSQSLNLDNSTDAVVSVFGREGFIPQILQDLPSVKNENKHISCRYTGDGNEECFYVGYSPSLVDSDVPIEPYDIFSLNILKDNRNSSDRSSYAPIYAELRIKARESRACSLKFNSFSTVRSPVRQITVFRDQGSKANTSSLLSLSAGIDEVMLHKSSFDDAYFRVGIQWLPKIITSGGENERTNQNKNVDALGVSVTCFWGEYDSETRIGNNLRRKVPAFDELLEYSPLYVTYANREKGLVKFIETIEV
ncbi:hypothetical protein HG536_0C03630 [Torulaspora globosa]|uniref:Peptide hydrolase n=1 Tax=Torulaspora globosa TaxID=48254 RepID=A0A7G3ZFA9_9SACH|nr:uncharacterized protein HG536_0C03630 [Torulaspora globosa]QLL32195.1 hypothetical protein HG536_0C03630 [Torulaspora globosa]